MKIDCRYTTEKAAEAIYEADRNNWLSGRNSYAELHEDDKNRLRAMARAAFEALNSAKP